MKRALLVILMIALLSQQTASSFVPPAAGNWLFNRTIASIMREVAKRRGISAADPRLAATEAAMSSELTALNVAATGVGVGLTMLGTPVWLTVLAGLGIVAGGSALIAYLGNEKIQIDGDGRGGLSVSRSKVARPTPEPTTYAGLTGRAAQFPLYARWLGFKAVEAGFRIYRTKGCFESLVCSAFPLKEPSGAYGLLRDGSTGDLWVEMLDVREVERWIIYRQNFTGRPWKYLDANVHPLYDMEGTLYGVEAEVQWEEMDSESREMKKGTDRFFVKGFYDGIQGVERFFARERPETAEQWYESLEQAYVGTQTEIHGATVSNETLANVVNAAWRRAAGSRPDYRGLPYSVTDPVTTADIEPWAKANPEAVPRVEDLFRPASLPHERTVLIREKIKPHTRTETETETKVGPKTDPETETKIKPDTKTPQDPQLVKDVNVVNRPTVDIGNPVKVDLGTAPQIAPPTLEEPPTATMILDPILKLLPGFKDWKTPNYKAQCPRPTFDLFNTRVRMDAMCDLAEKLRPTLRATMLAIFVLAAVVIVLGA